MYSVINERYNVASKTKEIIWITAKNRNGKGRNDKKLLCLQQEEKADLETCMQIRKACKRAKALIMEDCNYTSAKEAGTRRRPLEGGTLGENGIDNV